MKLTSFLSRLFLGEEILEQVDSLINGRLKVSIDIFGNKVILGGGISQSGGLTVPIYKKAIVQLKKAKPEVKNALILGFGAGTFASLLNAKYPGVTITGVELDPVMIDLGKRYFGLDSVPTVKIEIGDAYDFVTNCTDNYDLIFVDLYLGQVFPEQFIQESFFSRLKTISKPDSVILFNRLNWSKHKTPTAQLAKSLTTYFTRVTQLSTQFNLLIFCSP